MARRKRIATLTLNPSLDLTLRVPRLIHDDSNRVTSTRKDPGGKGINVSRVLHELGVQVTTLTVLGGNAGREFRRLTRRQGLSLHTVRTQGETRENIMITETEHPVQTRLHQPGAAIRPRELARILDLIEEHARQADYFVLGGSLPPGVPQDIYQKLILRLRERKVQCVLDADGEPFKLGVAAQPFLIKPNLFELGRLVGKKLTQRREAKAAVRQLLGQGIQIVILSLGSEGALAATSRQMVQARPPLKATGSTVGAGDSLVAGFLMRWAQGAPLRACLRAGVAAGTATALTPGTELLRAEDYESIYRKVKVIKA